MFVEVGWVLGSWFIASYAKHQLAGHLSCRTTGLELYGSICSEFEGNSIGALICNAYGKDPMTRMWCFRWQVLYSEDM